MKNETFIYGIHPVLEALDKGKAVDKVWILEGQHSGQLKDVILKLRELGIVWKQVPAERLNKLIRGNHQGVVMAVSAVEFARVDDVIAEVFEKGLDPLIVVLDGVTDVRNFGAIARTAACAGVHAIVVPETGSAALNADAVRTSAGALLRIPVCRTRSVYHTLKNLKNSGLMIAGATEKGSENIYQSDFNAPLAIVFGSEDTGLSNDTMKCCDKLVYIPLSRFGVGSLNVSVAAGVALFEVVRQRESGNQ